MTTGTDQSAQTTQATQDTQDTQADLAERAAQSMPDREHPLPDAVAKGSVVVGVDGSSGSDAALDWAADAAARAHRVLSIVHTALPVPPWYGTGTGYAAGSIVSPLNLQTAVLALGAKVTAAAADRARARHADLEIVTVSDTRDPRRALVDVSDRAHLLVVGSRGRGPVATMLLGSVSVAVTREARCPVVVVRPGSATGSEVLALVDGSPDSESVLEMAYSTAAELDAPVVVLHVLWTSFTVADVVLDDARLLLAQTVAGLGETYPDVSATTEVIKASGPEQLLERATDAALVVVGHHPAGTLHRLLYRSVSAALLERATVPVAVVGSHD